MENLCQKFGVTPDSHYLRQVLISWIRQATGCQGVWHSWETLDIAKVYDAFALEMGWPSSGVEY